MSTLQERLIERRRAGLARIAEAARGVPQVDEREIEPPTLAARKARWREAEERRQAIADQVRREREAAQIRMRGGIPQPIIPRPDRAAEIAAVRARLLVALQRHAARIGRKIPRPPVLRICEAVCRMEGVPIDELVGPRRLRRLIPTRQIVMWLARETGRSLPEVGRAFERDHTTVLHAVAQVRLRLADPAYADRMREIIRALPIAQEWQAKLLAAVDTEANRT